MPQVSNPGFTLHLDLPDNVCLVVGNLGDLCLKAAELELRQVKRQCMGCSMQAGHVAYAHHMHQSLHAGEPRETVNKQAV